jgi:hypothetical protein
MYKSDIFLAVVFVWMELWSPTSLVLLPSSESLSKVEHFQK